MEKPVTWRSLRDKLLIGANDRGGIKLTVFEAHYLLQLADNLDHDAPSIFRKRVENLDDLESQRVEDDQDLARRDAKAEKD